MTQLQIRFLVICHSPSPEARDALYSAGPLPSDPGESDSSEAEALALIPPGAIRRRGSASSPRDSSISLDWEDFPPESVLAIAHGLRIH